MKFFISGEIGFFPDEVSRAFSSLIMEIQKKMDLLLAQNDYGNELSLNFGDGLAGQAAAVMG
jgi:hypothetical protein